MNPLLNAALDYASRGWAVFPCSPGSKIPFAGSGGSKDATTDEDIIRDWWLRYPTANVAIATGSRSGLYVIDVDAPASEDLARLAPTLQARTPRRGWHYLYAIEPGTKLKNFAKTAGIVGADTDGRGEGGYVVAYPSVIINDGTQSRYEWVNIDAVEIAPLPEWIVDKLTTTQRELPREAYAMSVPAYGKRALENEAQAVAHAPEGGRNDQLNRSAFALAQLVAGGHLSQTLVESVLLQAGLHAGLRNSECVATIRSGMRAGLQHPRGPRVIDPEVIDEGESVIDAGLIERNENQTNEDRARWSLLARVRALGGLCDTVPGWIIRGADHPQPGLTLASTLALGSVMSGRRLTLRGTTSSMFICAIAPSGDGKNRPQSCIRRLLGELWGHLYGPTSFSSSVALIDCIRDATDNGHATLMVVDEYGMQLRGLIGRNPSAHRADIKQILTELSTVGTGAISPAKSRSSGGGAEHILAPALTLLGSSTPESLHSTLGGLEVADGFVGRHLWFEAQAVLPPWQPPEQRGNDDTPIEIRQGIERLRAWHEEWFAGLPQAGISSDSGKPMRQYDPVECWCDDAATAVFNAYKMQCDERKRRGDESIPRALLGRSPEYATRIAIVLALLASPELDVPHVTQEIAEVAIAVADASATTFARSLQKRAPEWNDPETQIDYVIRRMQVIAGKGSSVSRSELLSATRKLTAKQLDDVLHRLIEEGYLIHSMERTGGRMRSVLHILRKGEPAGAVTG